MVAHGDGGSGRRRDLRRVRRRRFRVRHARPRAPRRAPVHRHRLAAPRHAPGLPRRRARVPAGRAARSSRRRARRGRRRSRRRRRRRAVPLRRRVAAGRALGRDALRRRRAHGLAHPTRARLRARPCRSRQHATVAGCCSSSGSSPRPAFLTGLLANGGGFLLVPIFVLVLGLTAAQAAGTSMVAVAALIIPTLTAHIVLGHVDWAVAGAFAVGGDPRVDRGRAARARAARGPRPARVRRRAGDVLGGLPRAACVTGPTQGAA